MIKNILIGLLLLASLVVFGIHVFSQRAPVFLREAIERALHKKVTIENIEYRFPWVFELRGVTIQEDGEPFRGEGDFYTDHIRLEVSPITLSRKELVINRLEIKNADIVIRKTKGRLYHALSDVMSESPEVSSGPMASSASSKIIPREIPLKIFRFVLEEGRFKFIDYDASGEGFVVTFDKINANIRNIIVPPADYKTFYQITAELIQGRDQRRAPTQATGWTYFNSWETDATISMKNLHLPYFRPYYSQVTGAALEDGYADARAGLKIFDKKLDLSLAFELSGLLFESYELDNQLFGLKADEILDFLKDSSGRLRFQIVVKWDLSDKSVKLKEIFRRSIERSLRETVLGNVGDILASTLQKIGDSSDLSAGKTGLEDKIKKIKDFFKY